MKIHHQGNSHYELLYNLWSKILKNEGNIDRTQKEDISSSSFNRRTDLIPASRLINTCFCVIHIIRINTKLKHSKIVVFSL